MSANQAKKSQFVRNSCTKFLLSTFSNLRGGGSDNFWAGNLADGQLTWSGDDGSDFIAMWKGDLLLAAAQVLECDRFPEDDDGWDEDSDKAGKKRGLKYLGSPPPEIQALYVQALRKLPDEYVTAGLWIQGEKAHLPLESEADLECGLEYFCDFFLETKAFPLGRAGEQSWMELHSLEGELKPVALLACELSGRTFQGGYRLSEAEKATILKVTDPKVGKTVLTQLLDEAKESLAQLELVW